MDAVLWVQQGLTVAVALALPVVLAALAASLMAGALAGLFGLQEPTVGQAARVLAVVAVAAALAEPALERAEAFTRGTWARISEVGAGSRR